MEIEKSNEPSSLFTKIFLEKEVYFEDNEFKNNYRYIDYLFNASKRDKNSDDEDERLEYLLGV